MSLRRRFRNLRAVTPFIAVLIAIAWVVGASAVERPDVVFFRIGDKFAVIGWGLENADQELPPPPPGVECPEGVECDFGGYRLWMREVWKNPDPSPESFSLVREYVLGETDENAAGYWHFPPFYAEEPVCLQWVTSDSCHPDFEIAGVRRDSAAMFSNSFPYEFSVTAFSTNDPQAIDYEGIDANRTGIVYPRVGTQSDLSSVRCIPNPYRASADWEYGGQRRVTFIGLPESATIRIYTASADHVRTLVHNDGESDLEFWDLRNADGEEIAPGVYMYLIDSGTETIEGKVMIIK